MKQAVILIVGLCLVAGSAEAQRRVPHTSAANKQSAHPPTENKRETLAKRLEERKLELKHQSSGKFDKEEKQRAFPIHTPASSADENNQQQKQ